MLDILAILMTEGEDLRGKSATFYIYNNNALVALVKKLRHAGSHTGLNGSDIASGQGTRNLTLARTRSLETQHRRPTYETC